MLSISIILFTGVIIPYFHKYTDFTIFSQTWYFNNLTLHPTAGSKDLSLREYSNGPAANYTLNIRSTASSILAIGIFPDCTRYVKSSRNNWYRKGTMTCIFTLWVHIAVEKGQSPRVELKIFLYHINSSIDGIQDRLLIVRSMRMKKPVQSFSIGNYEALQKCIYHINLCCNHFHNRKMNFCAVGPLCLIPENKANKIQYQHNLTLQTSLTSETIWATFYKSSKMHIYCWNNIILIEKFLRSVMGWP